MSYKFCPFSFFSFYVNKESAQAGGAHHCVEDACALWDSRFEQCVLKSACETLADSGVPVSKKAKPNTGAVGSILTKLRNKKLPTATETIEEVPKTIPSEPASQKPVQVTEVAKTTDQVAPTKAAEQAAPVAKPTPAVAEKVAESLDDLLNPPNVPISELPIVSLPADEEKESEAQ